MTPPTKQDLDLMLSLNQQRAVWSSIYAWKYFRRVRASQHRNIALIEVTMVAAVCQSSGKSSQAFGTPIEPGQNRLSTISTLGISDCFLRSWELHLRLGFGRVLCRVVFWLVDIIDVVEELK
jgi:hypothetical protein